jgi:transposase, IS5 family
MRRDSKGPKCATACSTRPTRHHRCGRTRAYRSKANEDFLAKNGFTSKIHRRKPQGRPMPKHIAKANAKKAAVRARVERVFAEQKDRMELFVRTIGLTRTELKVGMANLVYNIKRTAWLGRRAAPG